MKKTTIITLICAILMIISFLPSATAANPCLKAGANRLRNMLNSDVSDNITFPAVDIKGPVSNTYSYVSLEGNDPYIDFIDDCTMGHPPLIAKIVPFAAVVVAGISFTIHFKENEDKNSRYQYYSKSYSISFNFSDFELDIENETIENQVHKIRVENFTGAFIYTRGRLIRGVLPNTHMFLIPARYRFIGYAEDISFLPI